MKLGIIGKGVVGEAFGDYLSHKHNVVYYDKFKKENDFSVLRNSDFVFICTPTPMNKDGSANIESVIENIERLNKLDGHIIIKSTVPVGTTDYLSEKYKRNIIFSPEFLRERHAHKDVIHSDYIIYGAEICYDSLNDIFSCKRNIFVTRKEAEMIKYSRNAILASQISTANEIKNISERLGVDYKNIVNQILLDDRIGKNILVPGPDGKEGFGGACLPKDISSLIFQAEETNYNPKLLNTIWREYGRK